MKLIMANLVIIIYASLSSFAYFFSDSMIFFPPPTKYYNFKNLIKLPTADGSNICAYHLSNPDAKYTILVSHGNADDLGHMRSLLYEMRDQGYSVFAYDYHGYGLSEGKPSEANTYLDINAAYDYLTTNLHIEPENIILYGYSLGAAVTLDLAVRKPVAGVILSSAFTTVYRVVTHFPILPFDKFDNLKKIDLLKTPLLMIHGDHDSIVPIWHGRMLYDEANTTKKFYMVENAGHNDVIWVAGKEFWQTIANFIKQNIEKNKTLTNEVFL
jgi:abhydrolase domain-containing protein 17